MYSKVAVGDAAPVSLGAVDAAQRATRVVVVGLGYVGLPLAAGGRFETIGLDIDRAASPS
jgi:UDP-N-acetyl-D-galactosamine dehydrogenase